MADREYPRQTYYALWKAKLLIRFDEFGGKTPAPPAVRAPVRKGTGKNLELLDVVREANGKYVLKPKGFASAQNQVGGPQQQKGPEDFEIILVPKNAQVVRQTRQGSTLRMEFRYADVPIDPRTVRSCGVEFFLGTIPAAEFQKRLQRQGASAGGGTAIPLEVLPDEADFGFSNIRFQGFVDEWEIKWAGDEPTISVQCTDNARLMAEQMAPPGASLNPKLAIPNAVAHYLAMFPQLAGMRVQYIGDEGEVPPNFQEAMPKTAFPPNLGPPVAKGGESGTKVLDYLIDSVRSLGLVLRVGPIGNPPQPTVIIQKGRNAFKLEQRVDDIYQARRLPSGAVLPRRTLVYGRNIEELHIKRNFTKFAPMNIELRSYNPIRKKTLVTRFPNKNARQNSVNPGGATDQKWIVIQLPGVGDEKTLKDIALTTWQAIGKNEMMVEIKTRNLASYGGGNAEPDLLWLEPADSIDVQTTREKGETGASSTVLKTEEDLVTRAREHLKKIGYPDDFSEAYARSFINDGIVTTFFVRKVEFDCDVDEGTNVSIEAVNYVTVRADKALSPGPEITPNEVHDVTVEEE